MGQRRVDASAVGTGKAATHRIAVQRSGGDEEGPRHASESLRHRHALAGRRAEGDEGFEARLGQARVRKPESLSCQRLNGGSAERMARGAERVEPHARPSARARRDAAFDLVDGELHVAHACHQLIGVGCRPQGLHPAVQHLGVAAGMLQVQHCEAGLLPRAAPDVTAVAVAAQAVCLHDQTAGALAFGPAQAHRQVALARRVWPLLVEGNRRRE